MSANSAEEYSQCLNQFVSEYLNLIPNFNEDVNYVAEYIVLLMSNSGTVESVTNELQSLFESVKPEDIQHIVTKAFEAVQQLNNGATPEQVLDTVPKPQAQQQQQQQQQQQPVPQQPQQQPVAPQPVAAAGQVAQPGAGAESASQPQQTAQMPHFQFQFNNTETPAPSASPLTEDAEMQVFEPSSLTWKRDRDTHSSRNSRFGGIQKGKPGNNNNNRNTNTNSRFQKNGPNTKFNQRNTQNKMLNAFNKIPLKTERCKDFPNCPLNSRECPGSHPTIICALYPNCERRNKTCSFLHPDEDGDLIEELKKKKIEYNERKAEERQLFMEKKRMITSGITLCKFGAVCANPKCPFGHPTPINDDQKVSEYTWCPANLECQDMSCTKAHSSPAKIKDIKPLGKPKAPSFASTPRYQPPIEKSLEQCKYGIHCTNKKCKYRHAKAPVMCRDGAACTRIDCVFGHPIPEPCRFGVNCKNKACLFQHPEGRIIPSTTWVNPDTTGTVNTPEQSQQQQQPQFQIPQPTLDQQINGQFTQGQPFNGQATDSAMQG